MKIAYIGNFEPEWSTENDVRKAFEHLGHSVERLQENKAPWQFVRQIALESDLLLWTSTWEDELGGQPVKESLETLRLCALKNIPTATYHLDIFFGADRGNRRWLINPMLFTRYVFTADGDHEQEWDKLGVNHIWLRPGIRHDAAHFGTPRAEYECDVAFLGSNGEGYHMNSWMYRKELVDFLRDMCRQRGWSWKNPGGDDPKIDRSEDRNDFYASAKITVGDSLCHLKEASHYCSDRVYEATGCGGFLIMPHINFVAEDFNFAMPMYKWGDFDGLEKMIGQYLADEPSRKLIQDTTQKISAAEHTYANRAQTIIETTGAGK